MNYALKMKNYIDEHRIESKESALKTTMTIQASELNAGGPNYTRTLHIPKFYTQEDKKRFESIVDTMYQIFSKVIKTYQSDEEIRKLFGFSKELEELILLKPRYDSLIPICRVDIFYDEKTKEFGFCEFNTDGTSAMNENKRLNEFLSLNNAFMALDTDFEIMELVNTWVDVFLKICHTDPKLKEKPNIAIVDFLDKAYLNELYVFERVFKEKGYQCEVVDIRNLEYRDHKLWSTKSGMQLDVIYRRAVTKDVMENLELVKDFIDAIKADDVSIIGAFQTQLIHHKCINQVLLDPLMQKYFTQEEVAYIEKHLPKTYDLTKDVADMIKEDKNQWIIKPKDSYAAKGVWAGVDLNTEEWKHEVEHWIDKDYIAQEYITPYKTENIDLVNYDDYQMYSNLTGLYVYDGQFAGVYSRLSDSGIISTQYNEKTVPTLFIKEES